MTPPIRTATVTPRWLEDKLIDFARDLAYALILGGLMAAPFLYDYLRRG